MLKLLENSIDSDSKLQKAPVNYEGVSSTWISPAAFQAILFKDVLEAICHCNN